MYTGGQHLYLIEIDNLVAGLINDVGVEHLICTENVAFFVLHSGLLKVTLGRIIEDGVPRASHHYSDENATGSPRALLTAISVFQRWLPS